MEAQKEPIRLLIRLYSALEEARVYLYPGKELPFWVRNSAKVTLIDLGGPRKLALIFLKDDADYNQLIRLQRQVQKCLEMPAILIADNLNPKYRSNFVRNRISFIYKDKSLFAPELGIQLMNLKAEKEPAPKEIKETLNPFELKLLAGFLTDDLQEDKFNLRELTEQLGKQGFKGSYRKIAQVVNALLEKGFLIQEGSGPHRKLAFKSKQEVWENLKDAKLKKTHKLVESYYDLDNVGVYAGETALSHFSTLIEPSVQTIAVTNKEFRKIQKSDDSRAVGHFGKPCLYFEIRKEDPWLFCKDEEYLNPIEVYFSLKDHTDERVQIALDECLKNIGLERN